MLIGKAGGGASSAIGDKVLTLNWEVLAQNVTHFGEIRQLLNAIMTVNVNDLAGGQPATATCPPRLGRTW